MPFIIPTIIEKKKEIEGTEFTFALHIIKEYETEEDASDEEKGEFKRSEIYLIRSDGSNILLSVEPNQLSAMSLKLRSEDLLRRKHPELIAAAKESAGSASEPSTAGSSPDTSAATEDVIKPAAIKPVIPKQESPTTTEIIREVSELNKLITTALGRIIEGNARIAKAQSSQSTPVDKDRLIARATEIVGNARALLKNLFRELKKSIIKQNRITDNEFKITDEEFKAKLLGTFHEKFESEIKALTTLTATTAKPAILKPTTLTRIDLFGADKNKTALDFACKNAQRNLSSFEDSVEKYFKVHSKYDFTILDDYISELEVNINFLNKANSYFTNAIEAKAAVVKAKAPDMHGTADEAEVVVLKVATETQDFETLRVINLGKLAEKEQIKALEILSNSREKIKKYIPHLIKSLKDKLESIKKEMSSLADMPIAKEEKEAEERVQNNLLFNGIILQIRILKEFKELTSDVHESLLAELKTILAKTEAFKNTFEDSDNSEESKAAKNLFKEQKTALLDATKPDISTTKVESISAKAPASVKTTGASAIVAATVAKLEPAKPPTETAKPAIQNAPPSFSATTFSLGLAGLKKTKPAPDGVIPPETTSDIARSAQPPVQTGLSEASKHQHVSQSETTAIPQTSKVDSINRIIESIMQKNNEELQTFKIKYKISDESAVYEKLNLLVTNLNLALKTFKESNTGSKDKSQLLESYNKTITQSIASIKDLPEIKNENKLKTAVYKFVEKLCDFLSNFSSYFKGTAYTKSTQIDHFKNNLDGIKQKIESDLPNDIEQKPTTY